MKRRKGISSIYGFIMIFLLSMASVQTWSTAVSSMASIESASDQGNQLRQMQSIEHLALQESGTNLTISNDGEIPSMVQYLRISGPNDSRTVAVGEELAVGSSMTVSVPTGYAVEVVTALGNVFSLWPAYGAPSSVWSGQTFNDGQDNAQLFQNPYHGSSFFLTDGPTVYAFSGSGVQEWSFDAGSGYITDVMPLSSGVVYVSAGYGTPSNAATLFELSAGGTVLQTYDVRLYQTPEGVSSGPSLPVVKGEDASYALYDGWFYSANGPSGALVSDLFPLAGTGPSDFYFYQVTPDPYNEGVCQNPGNELVVSSYSAGPDEASGVALKWKEYSTLGTCNRYPQQLLGTAVGGGVVGLLLASPPYASSLGEDYPGQSPYLVVDSSSGSTLYDGQVPDNDSSAIATNGTDVYIAVPQPGEIQVYSLSKNSYTTYGVGIQASQLIFDDGNLFAISSEAVKVFSPSMSLEKTIDFAPLSLASTADSFLQEAALQAPSFLVLNSTSYAALVINATGFTSLVLGRYS